MNKTIDKPFQSLFSKDPIEMKNGIPYYGSEREGDQFTNEDIAFWTSGGRFAQRWRNKGKEDEYANTVYMELCRKATSLNLPIMDIASGPGLGLIPDIFAFNPTINALATDACPAVVMNWQNYLRQNAPDAQISFACFNAADMPIKSDSIDAITSNIGFSSLRYAGANNMLGVHEAFRVLKPDGYVFAIENEFEDMAVIQKAFELWGKVNWFKGNTLTWRERFERSGFVIEEATPHLHRVEKENWELGEVAASYGLEIVVNFTAYVLRKPDDKEGRK